MMTPAAFRVEPYTSLVKGSDEVLWYEATKIVALSSEQIASLQEVKLFPLAKCDPLTGLRTFNRKKLVAWRWAVHQKNWLADAVEYWLGRGRRDSRVRHNRATKFPYL